MESAGQVEKVLPLATWETGVESSFLSWRAASDTLFSDKRWPQTTFLRKWLWSWISNKNEGQIKAESEHLNLRPISRGAWISPEPEICRNEARMALFLGKGKYSLELGTSDWLTGRKAGAVHTVPSQSCSILTYPTTYSTPSPTTGLCSHI